MNKVKIGVVGIGNMGTGHSKWLAQGMIPEMELCAVCDIDPRRLELSLIHI